MGDSKTDLRPIGEVADELGLDTHDLLPIGHHKAKVRLEALQRPATGKGRLVLVSAITPTPPGEGKTTTSVALAMGLRRIGKRAIVCLREPSLGPVFGVKGGGTGGGRAHVVPADDINLHFTGDIHAVTSAHNLLGAMLDNDLHFGAPSGLDPRKTTWPRVMDMNDRALRHVLVGLGGVNGGVPRETRFDITAASEIMAILCLADSVQDLRGRIGRVVVGARRDKSFVTAEDIGAGDAMTALLLDAIQPNLVQTAEGGPALVHGGPFANIAHGCSSLLATKLGLRVCDYVITEAGFGFDLGGEKFLDIKCRQAGVWPRCVVLVATLRALCCHGGALKGAVDLDSLGRGLHHLDRQVANVRAFGLEPVIAVNHFGTDPSEGHVQVEQYCASRSIRVAWCRGFTDGSEGSEDLARTVASVVDATDGSPPAPKFLYDLKASYADKLAAIATTLYGADGVDVAADAATEFKRFADAGYGELPLCVAKTHLSLSDDPAGGGLPGWFRAKVRSARLSAGAGFVVALLGDVTTMPGLSKEPAAKRVRVEANGRVRGLTRND